jgi:hypothetical protein
LSEGSARRVLAVVLVLVAAGYLKDALLEER